MTKKKPQTASETPKKAAPPAAPASPHRIVSTVEEERARAAANLGTPKRRG